MALASRLSGSGNVDAPRARNSGFSRALALLPFLLTLLAPASVRGDIYKWTDERGNTVISNVQPANSSTVSGMELLAAARPAASSPAAAAQAADSRTQQALEARIENLERQVQAQQYPQQQGVPQPSYAGDYYPVPAPPPPDPGYYSGHDPGYYPSYNPSYYPGYYDPPVYSVISVPVRPLVRRPGFVNRPVFVGRPPVFVGRPPVFVSRPPVFVGRSPAFLSQPALADSHRTSFGSGSMHRGRR